MYSLNAIITLKSILVNTENPVLIEQTAPI